MGLHRAGFEVVGVDHRPQPNYPFEFIQADALAPPFDLSIFDLIWASPPCQRYIRSGNVDRGKYPDLVGPVKELLANACASIIENVPGAPMRPDFVLCGSMFGLPIRRHRWFETSWTPTLTPPCDHSSPITGVYGNPHGKKGAYRNMLPSDLDTWSQAMQIDWMNIKELTQAIPPAYSEFLARSLA